MKDGKYWDVSWNPVTGCSPCSPGCDNCWAKRMAYRFKGRYDGYPIDDPFRVTFHPERLNDPLKWRKPKRIFVGDMGDMFHPDVDKFWIGSVMDTVHHAYWHTFFLLTKRPERMKNILSNWNLDNFKNLRLGVTVCSSDELWKIENLFKIPGAFKWLSLEPLLGDLDILKHLDPYSPYLNWIVVGAESGPGRRPAKIEWIRSIVNQCGHANIPCFVKQIEVAGRISRNPNEWSDENIRVREIP